MDILNNLFVNLYNAVNDWLVGWVHTWGLRADVEPVVVASIMGIIVVVVVLAISPFLMLGLTWVERKFVARLQNRLGPNRVGPWGLFQIFADMIKMLTKEDIVPANGDRWVHTLAPILTLVP